MGLELKRVINKRIRQKQKQIFELIIVFMLELWSEMR